MIYQELLSSPGRFLLLAVKGRLSQSEIAESRELYENLRDAQIYSLAVENQMVPLVADFLQRIHGDSLRSRWSQLLMQNQDRVDSLVAALESITAELARRGCLCAAVESGGVMLGTDLPSQAFCSGDFDLLVAENDWTIVCETFEAMGFAPNDGKKRLAKRVEFRRLVSGDQEQRFEVSFAPFDRRWVPLNYQDRCPAWLSTCVASRKATGISVLHPNHALVFVAFHTSLHSYIRAPGIRLQVDVDRLVRDCDIDWDVVMKEVKATGIATRVFVSLSMATGLLQTPVPREVLTALAPSRSRASAILRLLEHDGVIADGSMKLGRLKAVLLDILISERSVPSWFGNLLFPNETWMREHFEGKNAPEASVWSLHAQRFMALASRWRPE